MFIDIRYRNDIQHVYTTASRSQNEYVFLDTTSTISEDFGQGPKKERRRHIFVNVNVCLCQIAQPPLHPAAAMFNLFRRPTRPIEPHEYEKVYGKKYFPFRGLSLEEQMEFWESCRTLLLSRGYHLYKPASGPCHEWMSIPTLPSFSGPVQFPYAYSEAKARADSARDPFMGVCNRSMVFYAQDSEGRHVVLKHVCGNSQEYRILRFLQSQGVQAMEENCIMPVLELIEHKENWLVVMPRWGTISYHLPLHRTEDILQYMFCLLKALTFLHANSIVHRDITPINNLTNHIEAHPSKSAITIGDRQRLRDRGLIKYAMFDFDLSIRMPENVRLLPASYTWITVGPWPHDTAQGEYMYDPFAYDVALLGIVFCQAFQHLTQFVPMLAPLFDSMVTDDLSRRFTAAQALAFLSDNWKEFISTSQSIPYGLDEYGVHFWDKYDRWAGLPDDFVQKWDSFREPLPTRMSRFLRWMCDGSRRYLIVAWLRRRIDIMRQKDSREMWTRPAIPL